MRKKKTLTLFLILILYLGFASTAFAEEGDFVIEDGILTEYHGPGGDVVIPDGVTVIGVYSFSDCENLTSVTIPASVTTIVGTAFQNCTSLTNVVIPNTVTSIGADAFAGTPWLAAQGDFAIANGILLKYQGAGGSVTIPYGVTSIGDEAFLFCTEVTNVIIPDSVTSIGLSAFDDCTGLASVNIPNSVTAIGRYAFAGCTSLTSISIPDQIASIELMTFIGCTSLTDISIGSGVTRIENGAFLQTPWLAAQGEFAIVNGILVKYQGPGGDVTIPDGVTSIGQAFFEYKGLTSVVIPDGTTSIWYSAFFGCEGLTSVAIPASVTSIERYAFIECTDLTDIYYGGTKEQWRAISIETGSIDLSSVVVHFDRPMPGQPAAAEPTNDTLRIDGNLVEAAAYKIDGLNYFKLRDVAALLNGTPKQFDVGYDEASNSTTITTGEGYAKQDTDLQGKPTAGGTATVSGDSVIINGKKAELTVYKINGSNYFKLRDLGRALDFNVGWSAEQGMYVESDQSYTDAD